MEISIPCYPFSRLYNWLVKLFSAPEDSQPTASLGDVSEMDTKELPPSLPPGQEPNPEKEQEEQEEPLPTLEEIIGKEELAKTLALLEEIQGHLPATTSIRNQENDPSTSPIIDRASQVLSHLKRLS